MNIKIDKRLPFGFKGMWGKCYKKSNYSEKEALNLTINNNLKNTTWQFNNQLSRENSFTFNFTSNNNNYLGFIFDINSNLYYIISTEPLNTLLVYDKNNGGWQNENYKLIHISKNQNNDNYKNETLINFLLNNAKLLNIDTISYLRTTYYDIGYDVQFKYLEDGVDKSIINSQPVQNLITKGGYRIIKTTDAHFNDKNQYECIVSIGDIVKFENDYWIVEKIDERSIYTPNKQTFYYIVMKNIFDDVIIGVNRSQIEDV